MANLSDVRKAAEDAAAAASMRSINVIATQGVGHISDVQEFALGCIAELSRSAAAPTEPTS